MITVPTILMLSKIIGLLPAMDSREDMASRIMDSNKVDMASRDKVSNSTVKHRLF